MCSYAVVSLAADKEFLTVKKEKFYWVASACQDESFLRGCFKLDKSSCGTEVSKSFDGCWKTLEKSLAKSKLSFSDSVRKLDSCVVYDVANRHREKVEKTAVCELPKKEIL